MQDAINPVMDQRKPFLRKLLKVFVPLIMKALAILNERKEEFDNILREGINTGDLAKVKELAQKVAGLKTAVQDKINDSMQDLIEGVVGDLKKEITIEAIGSIFSPLGRLLNIFSSFMKMVDPGNFTDITMIILDHKERILKGGPQDAERNMDWEEWEVDWRSRWAGYDIRWYGRSLYYELWCLSDELAPIAQVVLDFSVDYSEIHYKAMKKFSFKFGDYLHGALEDKEDKRPFPEQVNSAMIIGYERSVKCTKKYGAISIHKHVRALIKTPIVGPIEKMITPLIEAVTKPLDSAIPSPGDQILNVESMVSSCINKVIEDVVDQILDEQEAELSQEMVAAGFSAEGGKKEKHHHEKPHFEEQNGHGEKDHDDHH